jgi:hypothetical protein
MTVDPVWGACYRADASPATDTNRNGRTLDSDLGARMRAMRSAIAGHPRIAMPA